MHSRDDARSKFQATKSLHRAQDREKMANKIEILGSGCPKCRQLEENTRKAVENITKRAEIVKVTDIDKIIEYGVMSTPALVIDGKVRSSGRIPEVEEIEEWLQ